KKALYSKCTALAWAGAALFYTHGYIAPVSVGFCGYYGANILFTQKKREAFMKQAVQELVGLMALEQLEVDLFRGQSQDVGQGSLFGGLVAGQALRAATLTVPEERLA